MSEKTGLGGALLRLLVWRLLVPALVCTGGYWATRGLLQWRGADSATAAGWGWIVLAVLAFCFLAAGSESPFVRAGEQGWNKGTGRTWDHMDVGRR